MLGAREALAAEPGAGSDAAADVGRSLAAIGLLHWDAGRADEGWEAFRTAEARLAEALRAAPGDVSVRANLGASREKLGGLLAERGRTREALDVLGRARLDLEMSGGPGVVPAEIRLEQVQVAASLSYTYLHAADFRDSSLISTTRTKKQTVLGLKDRACVPVNEVARPQHERTQAWARLHPRLSLYRFATLPRRPLVRGVGSWEGENGRVPARCARSPTRRSLT